MKTMWTFNLFHSHLFESFISHHDELLQLLTPRLLLLLLLIPLSLLLLLLSPSLLFLSPVPSIEIEINLVKLHGNLRIQWADAAKRETKMETVRGLCFLHKVSSLFIRPVENYRLKLKTNTSYFVFTDLLDPVNKVGQTVSHTMTNIFVEHPAVFAFPMFCVTLPSILSAMTLSIKLNGEVLVPLVISHSCTLIHCQLHILPNYLTSEIGVMYWQSSIVKIVVITSNWLKAWQMI